MPHFHRALVCALTLIGSLHTGCEMLGLRTPALLDSSLSALDPDAKRVNKLVPPSQLVSMQPARLQQQPGVPGELLALVPKAASETVRVTSNSYGSHTIGHAKKLRVYGTYYPRLTCFGPCAPKDWSAQVLKDFEEHASRGDRYDILTKHMEPNQAWLLFHKDSGASGVRIVRYWKWEDNKQTAYLCTAELGDLNFQKYAAYFLEACKAAAPSFG